MDRVVKEPVPDLFAPVRPRQRYAWIWAVVWLFYLIQPALEAWHHPIPEIRWGAMAVLAVFGVTYVHAFMTVRARRIAGARQSTSFGVVTTSVTGLLVVVLAALLGQQALGMFAYVAVIAMFVLPVRGATFVALSLIAGTAVAQLTIPGWHRDVSVQFGIFVASLAMWGVRQLILRNSELADARGEITRLTVADERNRFARDLHDILGHSLTVVAVKAELAGRLVRLDPDRAEREIAEVERLAREALADVRSAVAGFRDVTLAGELANARSALAAAGIDADLPTAVDGVPANRRELFGWIVREGVTNVVRHSGASRCRVRITPSDVEVLDDGRGPANGSTDQSGHGLAGIRERAEAMGGSLTVGRSPENGFALRVRV